MAQTLKNINVHLDLNIISYMIGKLQEVITLIPCLALEYIKNSVNNSQLFKLQITSKNTS